MDKIPTTLEIGMITAFLGQVTPACKDITHLASQSLDRSLPWSTRLKLQLQYRICGFCVRYRDGSPSVVPLCPQDHTNVASPAPDDKARLTEAFRHKHR